MRTLVLLALVPTILAAATGRIERVNFDLGAPSRQIAITATEGLDTSIEASIRRDGALYDVRDWTVLLWYGTAATNPPLGMAFTNAASGRGWARWDIDGAMLATNGRFDVQIVASHSDGTVQEWASGYMTIRADSTSTFQPVTFGAPLHAVSNALEAAIAVASTNLQAALTAEAVARASGDAVSLTNWQAVVYTLTNGAALGETALQPVDLSAFAATGTVSQAMRLPASDRQSWTYVQAGTNWLATISASSNVMVTAVSGGVGYIGPSLGAVWQSPTWDGEWWNWTMAEGFTLAMAPVEDGDLLKAGVWAVTGGGESWAGDAGTLPLTLYGSVPQDFTIGWAPQTNHTQIPAQPTVITIAQEAIDDHNANGGAHADIRAQVAAIPTNVVGGWLMWDSGSNVFWKVSATNLRFYVWP